MKGAGQALKARLIPLRANRGPVFPHQAVLSGGDTSPKFIYHQVQDITKIQEEGCDQQIVDLCYFRRFSTFSS